MEILSPEIIFNASRQRVLADKYDIRSFITMENSLSYLHDTRMILTMPDEWKDVIMIKHNADTVSDEELLDRNYNREDVGCFRKSLLCLGKLIKKYGVIHVPSPYTIMHSINEYRDDLEDEETKYFVQTFTDFVRLLRKSVFNPDTEYKRKLKEIRDIVTAFTDREIIDAGFEVYLYSFRVALQLFNMTLKTYNK